MRDARLATAIFLGGFGVLLIGAMLGLNFWPGESFVAAARSASARQIFVAGSGYSIIFGPLFWASAPSRSEQLAVFYGWIATTTVMWLLLHQSVPLSWGDRSAFPWPMFLATSLALPAAAALVWRLLRARDDLTPFTTRLRLLSVLCVLFVLVPIPALNLTATLHPLTFDLHTLHFDRVSGLGFTPALIDAIDRIPGLADAAGAAYGLTPIAFLAVALLQLRGRPAHVASVVLLWVGMTTSALVAYHLLPVAGPRYVFGETAFLRTLRDAASQPLATVLVQGFPRNAMPSMHFGWMLAACIVWWQTGSGRWSRAAFVVIAVLTAIATLHSGEHYAVDLVVAVPFVLANIALWTTGVPWRAAARRRVVCVGFGCWLAWVLLLRLEITTLVASPWIAKSMLTATAVVVGYQILQLRRFAAIARATAGTAPPAEQLVSPALPAASATQSWQRRFGALFFVSGAAALIYQVLFAKALALIFGSTAAATFTVLAVFLGGMAIGSVIGGAVAQRERAPLRLYALIEAGIGLYCAATPLLFAGIQSAYVAIAADMAADSPVLLVLRVTLGAAVLLVPTVLMGITLPLLAVALGNGVGRLGTRVAGLYFANTAGAAAGSLVAAYALIPLLGVRNTTLVATVLNLMVALAAIELAKRPAVGDLIDRPDTEPITATATAAAPRRDAALALATLGLVGLLSLGLEVVYVHLLAIVAGNSVYAFGLMLATFLTGLAAGGEGARRMLARVGVDARVALALAVLGFGAAVALGTAAWNAIPGYFASFENYPLPGGFGTREAIRGLVCALAMVPPTVFIGAGYVFAIDVATSVARGTGALALGAAAAINTAGNIAGVLLFGFVLLPRLGGQHAVQAIAATAIVWGLVMLAAASTGRSLFGRAGFAAAVAVVALAIGLGQRFDLEIMSSGANVYFKPQHWGKVIDHAESVDGGLTAVADRTTPAGSVRTLLTNGKFQGNDALGGEMQAQVGFALAPLLHQPRRDAALVIGYGTGVTARVFHDAGFATLDIAELSADIVRLADRHFAKINRQVSTLPGVHLHLTDGRNFLLLGKRRYDVVSIEITSIWFAGAASLYNQEFYRLVKARLAPGGVLQQWVQLHHLTPQDILTVVSTVRSEFAHVALYVLGGQGIIVATDDPAHAVPGDLAVARLTDSATLAAVRDIVKRPIAELRDDLMLDTAGIDRLIGAFGGSPLLWVSTDDNLELEYSTPKANANDGTFTAVTNRALLAKYHAPSSTD